MLAYGRVASILHKAGAALDALGPHPARAVDRDRLSSLAGFTHRFQSGEDLPRFARAVAALRRQHGSLGAAFAAGMGPRDPHLFVAAARFRDALESALDAPASPGLAFMLPSPDKGAAKRLCLYLRWMIRPEDGVDLGTWSRFAPHARPAGLIIPLDTHIARLGRYIGLTDRKSPGREMAFEITESLRAIRPDDPLYYDLALCHLGISGACPKARDPDKCAGCPIRAVCRLGPEPPGWRARGRLPVMPCTP